MPLIHGKSKQAISQNIKTEMEAGKPRKQSIAIALDIARRAKKAAGGKATFEGFIHSNVPGRTDKHPMDVKSGSYVIPADIVSGLGEGNTMAGNKALDAMFKKGPFGMKMPKIAKGHTMPKSRLRHRKRKKSLFDEGGKAVGFTTPVPIIAAGGEYVISPDKVAEIGGGDIDHGHNVLDQWVVEQRKKLVKTLKNLPPPAKD